MDDTAYLGTREVYGKDTPFGIRDRSSHMYLVGATGTGKSTMLENMLLHDIQAGNGLCFIDPHGLHARKILDYIPPDRIDDVIYLNVGDWEYPVGLNTFANVSPREQHLVVSAHMSCFHHLWGETWGTGRMEQLTRCTLGALLAMEPCSLLGLRKMLNNTPYRLEVIKKIENPEVRAYWEEDYPTWDRRYRTEANGAVLNKICQLFIDDLTRNMFGQSTTLDLRKIMDEKRILIVNLAKGAIGDENARFIGTMLTLLIYHTAMRRDPLKDNPPFYFYADECHNFVTGMFTGILSESRKYKLFLTLSNQYIEQMDEKTSKAIFGNVGSIAAFRVGQEDSEELEKQFCREIKAKEIVDLNNHHVAMKLRENGHSVTFQGKTRLPDAPVYGLAEEVIEASRKRYGRPREEVEKAIKKQWYERVVPLG